MPPKTGRPRALKTPKHVAEKHGGKEHFKGEKAAFLVSKAILFQAAQDSNRPGEFYDYITRAFIEKFGDDGSGDFTSEQGKLGAHVDGPEVDENMRGEPSQDAADAATKRFAVLRLVSAMLSISDLTLIKGHTIPETVPVVSSPLQECCKPCGHTGSTICWPIWHRS